MMKTKKIISKILVALALTFMIPQLVFLYMWEDLSTRSTLLLFGSTAMLIGIGAYLIWDIVQSIRSLFRNINEVAKSEIGVTKNELRENMSDASDEVEKMGSSIELISKKIVDNMEELQHSTALIEKTKRDLNASLLQIESVMNSMGDALIVIDSEYKIKQINPAAKALLKFDEGYLTGKSVDILFENLDEQAFFTQGGVTGKRMSCVTVENEKIPVDVNMRPQINLTGDCIGHVLVVRDMRDTLGLISRLEAANTSLEAPAQKRVSQLEQVCQTLKMRDAQIIQAEKMASIIVLTSGIADELNNPLGSVSRNMEVLKENLRDIISYTQLLEYGLSTLTKENDPERRLFEMNQIAEVQSRMKIETLFADSGTIIKTSQKKFNRIKQITNDLKILSQNDENKMEGVDLVKEIQEIIHAVKSNLNHNSEIIPNFEFIPLLTCYPQQMKQVFMSLIMNAVEAIGEGDVIRVRTFLQEGEINIAIQDTGPGIAREHLGKIFDPFYTTKQVEKGTGLGLYLSYGIVEKHGGKLLVESVLNEGTTFTIQLPVAAAEVFVHPALTIPAA